MLESKSFIWAPDGWGRAHSSLFSSHNEMQNLLWQKPSSMATKYACLLVIGSSGIAGITFMGDARSSVTFVKAIIGSEKEKKKISEIKVYNMYNP